MGLAQLPLAAVAARFSAIAWAACETTASYPPTAIPLALLAFAGLLFLALLLTKLASGILLTHWAARVERAERRRRELRERARLAASAAAAAQQQQDGCVVGGGKGVVVVG